MKKIITLLVMMTVSLSVYANASDQSYRSVTCEKFQDMHEEKRKFMMIGIMMGIESMDILSDRYNLGVNKINKELYKHYKIKSDQMALSNVGLSPQNVLYKVLERCSRTVTPKDSKIIYAVAKILHENMLVRVNAEIGK